MVSTLAKLFKLFAAVALLAALTASITYIVMKYSSSGRDSRPNIVLVIADDLGWDDVSFHGNDQIPTPNLDAFASHGVILNSLYSASCCTPSRGALLTGKFPLHIGLHEYVVLDGVYGSGLPLNHKLIPEHFRQLGYETHLIGKWHLGFYKDSLLPTNRGFDSHYGHYSGAGSYYSHTYLEMEFASLGVPAGYDLHLNGKPDFSGYGQYVTDLYNRRFQEIIENKGERPLFVIFSHMAPHGNYPGDVIQTPENSYNGSEFVHIKHSHRKKYAGLIKTIDDSFGKAIEVIADNGLLENSVILFMSDNGGPAFTSPLYNTGASNFPFRGHKFTPWQGAVRVAGFIWSSLLRDAPYVNNKLYHFVDILPSLYALAGGNLTDLGEIDGIDVWASISNQDIPSPRREVLLVYDRQNTVNYAGYAGIMGRYKLVSGKWPMNDRNNFYLPGGNRLNNVEELERRRVNSKAHRILQNRLLARNASPNWRDKAVVRCSWGNHLRCNDKPCASIMVNPTGDDYLEVEVKPVNDTLVCDFTNEPCLFDLKDDPCETTNVAKVYPHILQKLLDYVNGFQAAESAVQFGYRNCFDRNSNPALEDPPVWKPWAEGCDGLLGEPCARVIVGSGPCPPGGDIAHRPLP